MREPQRPDEKRDTALISQEALTLLARDPAAAIVRASMPPSESPSIDVLG